MTCITQGRRIDSLTIHQINCTQHIMGWWLKGFYLLHSSIALRTLSHSPFEIHLQLCRLIPRWRTIYYSCSNHCCTISIIFFNNLMQNCTFLLTARDSQLVEKQGYFALMPILKAIFYMCSSFISQFSLKIESDKLCKCWTPQ